MSKVHGLEPPTLPALRQARFSKACTLPDTRKAVCNSSFHGKNTQSQILIIWFCILGLNFICCLHLLGC